MKELVEYIARSIVSAPDEVVVTEETDEDGIVLKLQVADDDKGRVIGKQGRIAQAMLTAGSVDADDPEAAEIPLALTPVTVGVQVRLIDRLTGGSDQPVSRTPITFGRFEYLLAASS